MKILITSPQAKKFDLAHYTTGKPSKYKYGRDAVMLPKLKMKQINHLASFLKAHQNHAIKRHVHNAMLVGSEPDYSTLAFDIRLNTEIAYKNYCRVYSSLKKIKDLTPTTTSNEKEFIELVFGLYPRAPTEQAKAVLFDLITAKMTQQSCADKHKLKQPNVCRIKARYDLITKNIKSSIVIVFLN